ncbi:MAG TPA: class I SAM-dependent methyltransferase, partial [Candidatus Limnocylindrales bacterium]|nr:class I SAM-dependent methyltransferase [Candidatus Limnocylindrales bacterium]
MVAAQGVEATARWIAAARAQERARPDALVDDPWAEALAGETGMTWVRAVTARAPDATLPIVVRARFFDDWLLAQVARGLPMQVVILGAGLDTRAWRLAWPAGTTLYEVDRAAVLEDKATTMREAGVLPTCTRIDVPADLLGRWPAALLRAGLDPDVVTTFVAEGILFYLPDTGLRRVLGAVTSLAAAGS